MNFKIIYPDAQSFLHEQQKMRRRALLSRNKWFFITYFSLGFILLMIGIFSKDTIDYSFNSSINEKGKTIFHTYLSQYHFHLSLILGIMLLTAALFVLYVIFRNIKIAMRKSRQYAELLSRLNNKILVTVTDEFIEYSDTLSTFRFLWKAIALYRINKENITLFVRFPIMDVIIIERSKIESQNFETLSELLKAKVPKF